MRAAFVSTLTALLVGAGGTAAQPLPPDHPPLTGTEQARPASPAPQPEDLMKALESMGGEGKAKEVFEVASGAGRLFYARGRHQEAV